MSNITAHDLHLTFNGRQTLGTAHTVNPQALTFTSVSWQDIDLFTHSCISRAIEKVFIQVDDLHFSSFNSKTNTVKSFSKSLDRASCKLGLRCSRKECQRGGKRGVTLYTPESQSTGDLVTEEPFILQESL